MVKPPFRFSYFVVFLCVLFFAVGCSKTKAPPAEVAQTPAHAKLKELFTEEFKVDAITTALENTMWIYVPLGKSFLEITSSKKGPEKSPNAKKEFALQYLDSNFDGEYFNIQYAIGEVTKFTDNKGIGTKYSDEYSRVNRNIMTAISKAYANIERKVDSYDYIEKIAGDVDFVGPSKEDTHNRLVQSHVLNEQKVPDFFVMVIADIEKGLESRTMFYLQDMRRGQHDASFVVEYTKRIISSQPIGDAKIIGDQTGQYLDIHDISWNEFLAKQLAYRITYQYQMSSHKPDSGDVAVLIDLANQTLSAYPHRKYKGVRFENLTDKSVQTLLVNDIDPFVDHNVKPSNRMHNIKINVDAPDHKGL